MNGDTEGEFERIRREAELLYAPPAVDAALDRIAADVGARLGESNPVVLAVMVGGLIPCAGLLARIDFPLTLDFVHVTRYAGGLRGSDIHWLARASTPLAGRSVLVVDDILDEGATLGAILDYCREQGAREVLSAVLVDKRLARPRVLARADFTGLEVADRYVFGCGMDYKDHFRNLHGIYAVKGA